MHDLDQTLDYAEEFEDVDEESYFETASDDDAFAEDSVESDALGNTSDDDAVDQPLDDATETELAADLLDAEDDEELEQVINRAMSHPPKGRRPRRRGRSRNRKRKRGVGGLLKRLAKKALPGIGAVLGSAIPIVGPLVGRAVGKAASKAIHPEHEGLGPDDLDFETAKAVIRTASDAADNAERIPPEVPSDQAANAAVVKAARKHAPRLVRHKGASPVASSSPPAGIVRSGRWVRRGRKIVLLGI